jgi:uncharacterized membrane protein YeaQ/YmgE (transglycosylase-associated protein family)
MGIVGWLILGLIAGFITSKVVDHRGQGMVLDILLGIAGAFVGGIAFQVIGGWYGVSGFNVWSLVVATLGAIVVLLAWNAFVARRTATVR